MTRARIVPNFVRSQYSKAQSLLDGFNLIIEGDVTRRFSTREAAETYASSHNLTLVYSGQRKLDREFAAMTAHAEAEDIERMLVLDD